MGIRNDNEDREIEEMYFGLSHYSAPDRDAENAERADVLSDPSSSSERMQADRLTNLVMTATCDTIAKSRGLAHSGESEWE